MSKKTTAYNEDSFQRHTGLDGVRSRPTMYLGERGIMMVFHMFKEIFDNCLDEAQAGRNKFIDVLLYPKDNTYVIADRSEGIPVGKVLSDPKNPKSAKVSMLQLVFTELHTGAKFDNNAYKVSRGVHGVGAAAVNAVSSLFEVWTCRDKKWWYLQFKDSKPVGDIVNKRPPQDIVSALGYAASRGTIIRFIPDQKIVNDKKERALLDVRYAKDYMRDVAMLNKGVQVTVSYKGKKSIYLNKEGIKKVLSKQLSRFPDVETVTKPLVYESPTISLALQWTTYPRDDGYKTYVSSGETSLHGKHELGMRNALTKALSDYKPKNAKYAPKDLMNGAIGVFNYNMSQAEFIGQTKDKLTSEVAGDIEAELLPVLREFFKKNATMARKIIKRASDVHKSQEDLNKQLSAIADAKKASRGVGVPSTVLLTAPSATPETRELYIVEGDSAGGSAKFARNAKFQEVFKLQGKSPNALKLPQSTVLANQVVQYLLTAFGYDFDKAKKAVKGEEQSKNKDTRRVGKVILLPDADVDGGHIATLIGSLLIVFMPSLLDEERVYIVDNALYSAYYKGNRYFGSTFTEVASQLPRGASNSLIVRSKGWGEISSDALAYVAFNPETRRLIKVTKPTAADYQRATYLMAKETDGRKELLGL